VSRKQDVGRARYWETTIGEAAPTGVSVREPSPRLKLHVGQFHWWRRRLKQTRELGTVGKPSVGRRPAAHGKQRGGTEVGDLRAVGVIGSKRASSRSSRSPKNPEPPSSRVAGIARDGEDERKGPIRGGWVYTGCG
jgi:hypothetical protein